MGRSWKTPKKGKGGPTDQPTNWPIDRPTDRQSGCRVTQHATKTSFFLVYNHSFTLFFIKNYHSKSDFSRKRKFPSPISNTKSSLVAQIVVLRVKTSIAAKSQNISHDQAKQACHQLPWGRSPCNHLILKYTIRRGANEDQISWVKPILSIFWILLI